MHAGGGVNSYPKTIEGHRILTEWPYSNRNATRDPLGAQVGCKLGPTWESLVSPTTFCLVGPYGAAVGLLMCDPCSIFQLETTSLPNGSHVPI